MVGSNEGLSGIPTRLASCELQHTDWAGWTGKVARLREA
jgi:hypothetical protein